MAPPSPRGTGSPSKPKRPRKGPASKNNQQVRWKGRFRGNKRSFSNIGSVGWVERYIELSLGTLVKKIQNPNRIVFEFKQGRSEFICWSTRASGKAELHDRLLQENNAYIVKGKIRVQSHSEVFNKYCVKAKYSILLSEITIVSASAQQPQPTNTAFTLEKIKNLIRRGKSFTEKAKNLTIRNGEIYRYMGCGDCTLSIRERDPRDNRYYCDRCTPRTPRTRRPYLIIRNLHLRDEQENEISGVIVHHEDCVKLLGNSLVEELRTAVTDNRAWAAFQTYFGTIVNGSIAHAKPRDGGNLILKDVQIRNTASTSSTVISPPEDDEDEDQADEEGPSQEDGNPDGVICRNCIDSSEDENETDAAPSETMTTSGIVSRLGSPLRSHNQPAVITQTLEAIEGAGVYQLKKSKTGYFGLVIIVNINCDINQEKRDGSQHDVKGLEDIFPEIGIKVFRNKTLHNPNEARFRDAISQFKKKLVDDEYSSSFIVYMGHGKQNLVKLGDGKQINVYMDIMMEFSTENLPEFGAKPKIFILQACQNVYNERQQEFQIPSTVTLENILWCFPCLPGQSGMRNPKTGTYFIQALLKCLREHRTLEFFEIMKKTQLEMRDMQQMRKKKKTIACDPHQRFFNHHFYLPRLTL